MSQSHSLLLILVNTQQLRIGGDPPSSAEGQDDYGMGGESSPESQYSFGMNGSPSPVAQDDFGIGGPPSPVAHDGIEIGRSPSQTAPGDFGTDLPLPTLATEPFGNPSAARVWEWGKCALPSIASETPKSLGLTNSEVLQEVGGWGSCDVDGPPSSTAQEDFGMDLVLPAEVGERAGSPLAAPSQEVEDWDSAGMGGPPSPMAQDNFGVDLPISPGDGLQIEGIAADLTLRLLPTKAGEHATIPSAVYVRTLDSSGPYINYFLASLARSPSAASSCSAYLTTVYFVTMLGGYGYKTLQLLLEPVQHPPKQVLQQDFDVSTWAAILCAEGSRNCQIHAQVWNIYQQEKEMSEVIDDIIEQLDNVDVQNLV
ncbi:hypothetical protein EDB87DRAFT_1579429 [Lactarius vividus]|nr:hypothetical protein EDB87DRAFT_1579429 [Lactarius vividus]